MDDYDYPNNHNTDTAKSRLSGLTIPQFLSHLCNYGHPLTPIFIMEWITRGYRDVIENEEELIRRNKRSVVCPEAWVKCAKMLEKALKDRSDGK